MVVSEILFKFAPPMKKYAMRLTFVLLLVVTLAGCSDTPRLPSSSLGSYTDAEGFNRADSIVDAVGDVRNNGQRLLFVIDSLEAAGELSLPKTIFYRTIAYNIMGRGRNSLLLYAQLGNISMADLTTEADLYAYIYSYNNYVRLLCEMKRYDRALREAGAADRKLRSAGYDVFTEHHDSAQTIGECQLCLGQKELAAESFRKALRPSSRPICKWKAMQRLPRGFSCRIRSMPRPGHFRSPTPSS